MRILWLNNSPNPCGGTLQATHSMVSALPDCEHTVSLQGKCGEASTELFGNLATVVGGKDKRDIKYDIVVCQNSRKDDIPRGKGLLVYYAHGHNPLKPQMAEADLYLSVSRWQAEQFRLPEESVLHQPVTLPPKHGHKRVPGRIVIGRLCTANPAKWEPEGWEPWWRKLDEWLREAGIEATYEWVGCPPKVKTNLEVVHHPASLNARSLLWRWDYLLYTTKGPETFGRTIREAQRCGCVPIVDGKGGTREQVEDSGGLIWDQPNNLEDLRPFIMSTDVKLTVDDRGSLQRWRTEFLERVERVI